MALLTEQLGRLQSDSPDGAGGSARMPGIKPAASSGTRIRAAAETDRRVWAEADGLDPAGGSRTGGLSRLWRAIGGGHDQTEPGSDRLAAAAGGGHGACLFGAALPRLWPALCAGAEIDRPGGGAEPVWAPLVSLVAVLREEGRLPFAVLQRVMRTLTGVEVSEGALVAMVQQVAEQAEPRITAIRDSIRGSPVLHADETGWRQDGRNGYVWTFSTPQEQLFVRGNRAKGMLTEMVGDDYRRGARQRFLWRLHQL